MAPIYPRCVLLRELQSLVSSQTRGSTARKKTAQASIGISALAYVGVPMETSSPPVKILGRAYCSFVSVAKIRQIVLRLCIFRRR